MKKWRRDAEMHNLNRSIELGERVRHQGRRNKPLDIKLPKYCLMSNLLRGMYQRTGIEVVYGG